MYLVHEGKGKNENKGERLLDGANGKNFAAGIGKKPEEDQNRREKSAGRSIAPARVFSTYISEKSKGSGKAWEKGSGYSYWNNEERLSTNFGKNRKSALLK